MMKLVVLVKLRLMQVSMENAKRDDVLDEPHGIRFQERPEEKRIDIVPVDAIVRNSGDLQKIRNNRDEEEYFGHVHCNKEESEL